MELDLLDGAVGVEDDGGDGVVGAGAPVEEGARGGGDQRGGMAEDLLEQGDFGAVVGGDFAVGQARGVEAAAGMGGEQGGEDPDGGTGGDELDAYGGAVEVEGGEAVSDPDSDQRGERGVGRGHVVGQAGLDAGEEEDLDEGEDGEGAEGAQAGVAEGGVEGDGVEQDPGWGGEEQDAEVVPPGGEVAVELVGDATQDVQAEVLLDEDLAEAVQHEEMPGEGEGEEEEESEEEVRAEAAAEGGVEDEEREEGDEDGSAGGALAHQGDGEAGPVEVPAGVGGAVAGQEEVGEAEEGEEGAEGEQGVGFADAGYVEKAEGGEKDDGGEPSGEDVAGAEEPSVECGDEGDGGEGGAEAGGELGDAEELEEEGGDPVGEGRLVDPDEGVPVGDEPSYEIKRPRQHLARDLGVDAFVPVGETVVAEQGEDDEGGEGGREEGGAEGLAAGGVELGCGRWLVRQGHEKTIREVGWEGEEAGR